jgi:DNA-binding CsgD family transcriptional regulator
MIRSVTRETKLSRRRPATSRQISRDVSGWEITVKKRVEKVPLAASPRLRWDELLRQVEITADSVRPSEAADFLGKLLRCAGRLTARMQSPSKSARLHDVARSLPSREREALEFLLAGRSEKEAAHLMRLSVHTVHTYAKSLYRRFGVESRSELLAKWVKAAR